MKAYSIEVNKDLLLAIQILDEKIYEHNSSAIERGGGVLFSRIVRDETEKEIAGIAGWTWASACEITHLWVDERVRNSGIGKMLLEAAEAEARNKTCLTILVRSYSFQAPHFYEKHGYKTEYVLNNFPNGHSYHILAKRLA